MSLLSQLGLLYNKVKKIYRDREKENYERAYNLLKLQSAQKESEYKQSLIDKFKQEAEANKMRAKAEADYKKKKGIIDFMNYLNEKQKDEWEKQYKEAQLNLQKERYETEKKFKEQEKNKSPKEVKVAADMLRKLGMTNSDVYDWTIELGKKAQGNKEMFGALENLLAEINTFNKLFKKYGIADDEDLFYGQHSDTYRNIIYKFHNEAKNGADMNKLIADTVNMLRQNKDKIKREIYNTVGKKILEAKMKSEGYSEPAPPPPSRLPDFPKTNDDTDKKFKMSVLSKLPRTGSAITDFIFTNLIPETLGVKTITELKEKLFSDDDDEKEKAKNTLEIAKNYIIQRASVIKDELKKYADIDMSIADVLRKMGLDVWFTASELSQYEEQTENPQQEPQQQQMPEQELPPVPNPKVNENKEPEYKVNPQLHKDVSDILNQLLNERPL